MISGYKLMKLRYVLFAAVLFWAMQQNLTAQVSMCPLFTDNMVLQQKTDAPVWGTAAPGAEVSVQTSWNRKTYDVLAGEDGKWMVKVRTPKAGGPYSMTIKEAGGGQVVISNILIGEVWLCSGQSNMQMPVAGSWAKVLNCEQEVKDASAYPDIRLISVERKTSSRPEDDFSTYGDGWQICSSETIPEFSATAYFFGREIHVRKDVPVGLIHSSWGGTVIEAWMSVEALAGVKDLGGQAEMVSEWPEDRAVRRDRTLEARKAWDRMASAHDDLHAASTGFAYADLDDSSWNDMDLPGNIETVYPDYDGLVLVRRWVDIPEEWAGRQLVMHINGVDDSDVAYFNGVRIGRSEGWNRARNYQIPAETVKAGKAVVAIRITDTGGAGGVVGDDGSFYLQGPDGTRVSLAGKWKARKDDSLIKMPPRPVNMYDDPNWSTVLHNAMISPLVPYSIKGAIWYQGCSNDTRAYQYRDLMKLMIADWRSHWGYDFPFYITQLANYRKLQTSPVESAWAELREAQDMAARTVSNTGMAVTIDIGDPGDIHPRNKQEVGRRLALQALNKTYGMPVECSGPVYEGYEIDGDMIRVRFSSTAKGLAVKGERLEGFAIAGADRKFYWAEARVKGDCVEVSCKDVPRPLAVRYAWADNPLGNLYNTAGLPAAPFRTDDWIGVTYGNTTRY